MHKKSLRGGIMKDSRQWVSVQTLQKKKKSEDCSTTFFLDCFAVKVPRVIQKNLHCQKEVSMYSYPPPSKHASCP